MALQLLRSANTELWEEYPIDPVAQIKLTDDPGPAGVDLEFTIPADVVPWLIASGMMLVPAPSVFPDVIAVNTREAGPQLGPQLSILYCPPCSSRESARCATGADARALTRHAAGLACPGRVRHPRAA